MSDQAKFQKMLEVLLLLDCQYGRTIAELSERFEISQRTVYRYLDTFKQVGFVIENTNGYFKIDKENATVQEISHLLHFSEEEAFILSKAIHSIEDTDEIKSKLVNLNKIYLYRMTHVDNIPHILEYGITHRNSPKANKNYISIGDSSLIDNRVSTERNITNGSEEIIETIKIGDFIPFYFGFRTPMLYVIQNGFNGVIKREPNEIIYCVTNVQHVIENDLLFYFSDGHTTNKEFTKIFNSSKISEINNIIDFEATKFKYWKSDSDLDLKRRKEAEFLVKDDVPNSCILGYICYSESVRAKLLKLGINEKQVVVRENYYF